MNLQRALQGISCSCTVMLTFGTKTFCQYSINGIEIAEAKQNFSCSRFLLRLGFKLNLRYLIISRNLWRGMLLVNKGYPQLLLHLLLSYDRISATKSSASNNKT